MVLVNAKTTDLGSPINEFDSDCMILPSALFSYVDHLEIVEAKKNAQESKVLALIAIGISTLFGIVGLITAI